MSTEFSKKLQKLSRCSPLHPVHYWDPECAESPAHVQLVCNICRWQSHRKSANIDQGQGECIYILAIFWNCKMVFRFWTFHAGFKITLCGPILNYGKTKQYAIWQLQLQNWAAKRKFVQKNGKLEETTPKKIAMVWPRKLYPVGLEAITSKKTRNYKEKTKSRFDSKKWKKKQAVGRRNPGPNQWITP